MKRVDLIKKIEGFGCVLVRHGRKHATGVCPSLCRSCFGAICRRLSVVTMKLLGNADKA